jgi:hypothetical protein
MAIRLWALHRPDRRAARLAHEVAGTRTRFQPAALFHMPQRLQGRRQTDLVLTHQVAHRGHAVARHQGAGLDGPLVVLGQAPIQG